jgi:AcrR family transcriptional regulator
MVDTTGVGSDVEPDRPPAPEKRPPVQGRVRLAPEERRAVILDATIPLLRERGMGLTTREIADAAGVAEGTLFRVFDDKPALLIAAVVRALDPEPVVARFRAIDSTGELAPVLREVVEVYRQHFENVKGVVSVAAQMRDVAADRYTRGVPRPASVVPAEDADEQRPGSLRHGLCQMRARFVQVPAGILDAVADILAAHGRELRRDPRVCARVLLSIISPTPHGSPGSDNPLTAHEIVELFLDGMRARPVSPETSC